MKELSVGMQLITQGGSTTETRWERLASHTFLDHIGPSECNYFQENNNSMAQFPGTAVGFVLLKMGSDERQHSKMHTGLEGRLVYLQLMPACGEPLYN